MNKFKVGQAVVVCSRCSVRRWHGLRGVVVCTPCYDTEGQYTILTTCGRILTLQPTSLN